MSTSYLGQRYGGIWYFGPRYFGGSGAGSGVLAIYDGTITLRPSGSTVIDVGSTNAIEFSAFKDEISGSYPTNGTVSYTLQAPSGTPITSATDIPMPHVSGSSGASTLYRGALPAATTASLTPRQLYTVVVTATDTSGNVRQFTVSAAATSG